MATALETGVRVSVHMPAFNHAPYIAHAIDSVLSQQVGFPYELVIGDDASTDGTRAVALEYANRFPDRIRLLLHDRNLGIFENDQRILQACRGEYIAWLEADDIWASRAKLQAQIDLLDAHPEYSACCHRAVCVGDGAPATWRNGPPTVKACYTIDDLLAYGHFIPSCTLVFRAAAVRETAEWTRATPFLERTYAARLALHGPIGFIDEEWAAFRYHRDGIYARSTTLGHLRSAIATHRLLGTHLRLTARPAYRAGLARMYAELSAEYRRQHRRLHALAARGRARWYSPLRRAS